jgi:hypothetical protein
MAQQDHFRYVRRMTGKPPAVPFAHRIGKVSLGAKPAADEHSQELPLSAVSSHRCTVQVVTLGTSSSLGARPKSRVPHAEAFDLDSQRERMVEMRKRARQQLEAAVSPGVIAFGRVAAAVVEERGVMPQHRFDPRLCQDGLADRDAEPAMIVEREAEERWNAAARGDHEADRGWPGKPEMERALVRRCWVDMHAFRACANCDPNDIRARQELAQTDDVENSASLSQRRCSTATRRVQTMPPPQPNSDTAIDRSNGPQRDLWCRVRRQRSSPLILPAG